MRVAKQWIQSLARTLGYEIRRLAPIVSPPLPVPGKDAFGDQQRLLAGQRVDTIFDVGANTGRLTADYLRLFPTATIHAFEPAPTEFSALVTAFRDVPRVKPVQAAVSAREGKGELTIFDHSGMHSLLPESAEALLWCDYPAGMDVVGRVETTTLTIDGYCAQHGIASIQLMKMDIQGAEILALEGAAEMLSRQAIGLLYIEINFASFYADQATLGRLEQHLKAYGYTLFGLYDLHHGRNGQLTWGDALFVAPTLNRASIVAAYGDALAGRALS